MSSHAGRPATFACNVKAAADNACGWALQVAVWAPCGRGATYDCIRLIDGGGVPSRALAIRHSTLICGRLDGTVRMYTLVRVNEHTCAERLCRFANEKHCSARCVPASSTHKHLYALLLRARSQTCS